MLSKQKDRLGADKNSKLVRWKLNVLKNWRTSLLSCLCQQKCRSHVTKWIFFFNQARNSSSVSRKRHGRRWLSEKLNFSFILRQSSKFGGRRLELKGREEKRDAKGPFFIKRLWPKCSVSFFYWKRLNCLDFLSLKQTHKNWYLVKKAYFWNIFCSKDNSYLSL